MEQLIDREARDRFARENFSCSYLELDTFRRSRVDDHLRIAAANCAKEDSPDERVSENTGLTEQQADRISLAFGKALAAALDEQLPGLIRAHVKEALPEILKPHLGDALAELEFRTATSVDAAIAAAEAATSAIGQASGFDSLKHRLERISEHVSRHETRLQKVERE